MVPPARSILVGADDASCTRGLYEFDKIPRDVSQRTPPAHGPIVDRRLRQAGNPLELRSLAKEFGLGGVILFARNIGDPEQVAELSFEAARLVPDLPLWVSIDQEGGRV